MKIKTLILLFITTLASALINAEEVALKAEKDRIEQLRNNSAIPTGRFDGNIQITSSYGYLKMPTRVVLGLFHESPCNQAFQLVFEQIEESENNYWLAYEYIENNEIIFRADIDSTFRLDQVIDFEIIWLEHERIHFMVNDISHQPYVQLKSKTPFISIYSGSVKINYNIRESTWPQGRPPVPINNAPIN